MVSQTPSTNRGWATVHSGPNLECRKWGSERWGFKHIRGYLRKKKAFSSVFWISRTLLGRSRNRGQKINANFFCTKSFENRPDQNRGRPHQKVRFSAAPVMGRNFLTKGRPGVRVRNVRGKSGPKSLCLCCLRVKKAGFS